MRIPKAFLPAVICLAAMLAGAAARAETSEQRARQVIDECIAALGGPQFMGMKDRVEEGRAYSFYRDAMSGRSVVTISTQYLPPTPGKLSVQEREDFGKKKNEGSVIFTTTDAYQINFHGVQPLPLDRVKRYKETTMRDIFYILHQRMGEKGMLLQSRGSDVLDNRQVDIVDIIDGDNNTVTVYIDAITHFPVREVYYRWDEVTKDKDEEVSLFTKYRDVGGVEWPFTREHDRNGEKVSQIFDDSVRINQNLPDSLFTLPSGVRMIKRQ